MISSMTDSTKYNIELLLSISLFNTYKLELLYNKCYLLDIMFMYDDYYNDIMTDSTQ